MSLQYSDTTNKNGIIQQIERNCGFNDGDITGSTLKFAQFNGDVNLALDDAVALIIGADGDWQFDDTNHTDYPIITTDIVSGQRDYSFTVDGSSNLVLDIYKVMVAGTDGIYKEILPVDQQGANNNNVNTDSLIDGQDKGGTVTRYDKTGNGIFLDLVPGYNQTAGLKIFINREGSHFAVSDTTKKPGFAGLFHEYLALVPSYKYARTNGLPNKEDLRLDILTMERDIKTYYGKRNKDINRRMTPDVGIRRSYRGYESGFLY
jgi:hypothetical protein